MSDPSEHKENRPQSENGFLDNREMKLNPFSLPEGYFENLTPRIMQSVRNSGPSQQRILPWTIFLRARFLVPVAASVALLLSIVYITSHQTSDPLDFSSIAANTTLEEMDDLVDFDVEDLVAFNLVDYKQLPFDESAVDDIDRSEIFDYLMNDDDLDLNTIYEQI